MSDQHVPSAVIERIRKLMALTAERGATEHEAAIAAEHVQRLLAEHNLSMAVIEASGGDSGADGKREKAAFARRQVYKWQQQLMLSIGELNYVHVRARYTYKGTQTIFDGYSLIGRSANVATTQHMFDYLVQAIERAAREVHAMGDPREFFTKSAHSFKKGAADRIVDRLQEKRDEIVREQERAAREQQARNAHPASAGGNAVVVFMSDVIQNEKDLNHDFMNGLEPGTTARKRAEHEREMQEREAMIKRLVAEGMSQDVAWYMGYGYSRERAEALAAPVATKPEKPLTEAQRRKKEERERREEQRARDRQEREWRKTDWSAYHRGQEAGADIGLDPQIKHGSNARQVK